MARSVSLTTLRARVRRAGDWENATDRVTTAEVDDAINEGIANTWEMIVRAGGAWKRSESSPANTVVGQQSYALVATVLQLLAVKVTTNGSEQTLTNTTELALTEAQPLNGTTGTPQFYMLAGDYLIFAPTPDAAYSFKYSFVPAATSLVAPSDTFDGVNGWERGVVYYAVREIAFKNKEWDLAARSDAVVSGEASRIIDTGKRRDPLPKTMIDTRGMEQRNKRWLYR